MAAKYVPFFVFVWCIAAICSVVLAGSTLGPEHQETYNHLMSWSRIFSAQSWGRWEIPGAIGSFFVGMWDMLILNFTFMQTGPYTIVMWILWGPIIALVVWAVVTTFFGIFQRIVT